MTTQEFIVSIVSGAVGGGILTLITSIFNDRSAKRRHIKEIAVQAGIELYRQQIEIVKTGRAVNIYSMEYFILYFARMAELLDDFPADNAKLKQRLNELTDTAVILNSHAWESQKEKDARADGR